MVQVRRLTADITNSAGEFRGVWSDDSAPPHPTDEDVSDEALKSICAAGLRCKRIIRRRHAAQS
jgi:hypothetical protein